MSSRLFVARTRVARRPVVTLFLVATGAARLHAQTDFYNTDRGRPLHIEDATPIERHALEFQFAPLRLERWAGGSYQWGLEPRLEYGILPRTHLDIGAPFAWRDAAGRTTAALAGVDVTVLHALNVETTTLPQIAVSASALLPAGGFGPDRAYGTLGLLGTRSFAGAIRMHVNGSYTVGAAPQTAGQGAKELGRWLAGVAVDKTIAVRSLLFGFETFAQQPLQATEQVEWSSGAGLRYQVDPRWVLDLGAGRRYTGAQRAWYLTVGGAYAFAWRALLPQGGN